MGDAPLLVDCLNCEMGCNGGTGTISKDMLLDTVENLVEKRCDEHQKRYKIKILVGKEATSKELENYINKYWKPGLYSRTYKNLSGNLNLKIPSQVELQSIFKKTSKEKK